MDLYNMRDPESSWLIDSGCTSHVMPYFSDCIEYRKFPTPGKARLVSGNHSIEIEGCGVVMLEVYDLTAKDLRTLILQKVLIVPKAEGRYFSPRQMID